MWMKDIKMGNEGYQEMWREGHQGEDAHDRTPTKRYGRKELGEVSRGKGNCGAGEDKARTEDTGNGGTQRGKVEEAEAGWHAELLENRLADIFRGNSMAGKGRGRGNRVRDDKVGLNMARRRGPRQGGGTGNL